MPREAFPHEAAYCCLGCRIAAGITAQRGESGEVRLRLARLGLAIFLGMNVMVFTMALWSYDFYGAAATDAAPFDRAFAQVFRYLAMLFSLPILFLLGGPLCASASADLRRGAPSADLLIVLGVGAAYAASVVAVLRGAGPVYFDVGVMTLLLVTLGRWLEAQARLRANEVLESLERLLPAEALVLRDGHWRTVPATTVQCNDRLKTLPGERFAVDGRVERGSSSVDEQVLTGESRPRVKDPGDLVLAGSVNLDGVLELQATAPYGAGSFWRLVEAVRQARSQRGHYQRYADRAVRWLTPAALILALGAFAWHGRQGGFQSGLLAGLAVLLIACPCPLGLATPLAIWAAMEQAARRQVLFRSGEAIERLASVRALRFDKTGTLSLGTLEVAQLLSGDNNGGNNDCGESNARDEIQRRALIAANASQHAMSRAVAAHLMRSRAEANAANDDLPEPIAVREHPGRGVEATLPAGEVVLLGSRRMMAERGLEISASLQAQLDPIAAAGASLVFVGWSGRVRGAFALCESMRPEAEQAISACRDLNLDVAILSGDEPIRAAEVARQLGVPVEAGLLPDEKVAALDQARRRWSSVAMIGDGINDAPALAASDCGIALGCGTDLARQSAAVCLLGSDLGRIPFAVRLARQTVRTIRRNLLWAFLYNAAGLVLAAGGLLNPVVAAIAMAASSVAVVSSSLRLAYGAFEETNAKMRDDVCLSISSCVS